MSRQKIYDTESDDTESDDNFRSDNDSGTEFDDESPKKSKCNNSNTQFKGNIDEEMENCKHLWEDSVQSEYILKKIVLHVPTCTCGRLIGKHQKDYQDLVEYLLDNEREMLEREFITKRTLDKERTIKMKEINFITEAQLQAQYRLGFTRECCLIKMQCPSMPYINNQNGRAFTDEKNIDRPIFKAGPIVIPNIELPNYPSIKNYFYEQSPSKQTVQLKKAKDIEFYVPDVEEKKKATIKKIKT